MSGIRSRHLLLAAAAAAALLVVSCAGAPPRRDTEPVQTADGLQYHAGTRTDQDKIPVLSLAGSPYEVGLQYGVLLRPEISRVYAQFTAVLDELTGGGLRKYLFLRSYDGKLEAMRAALPAGQEDELRGIADGARIRFSDFLFFSLAPEFLFDTSCTSIVARQGQEIAHGRNFDFMEPASFIARYPAIVRVAGEGKVPYVNVGFIGLAGVYTGFNDRGIMASVNTAAFSPHAQGKVIPVGFLVKSVLESSSNLAEVDVSMAHAPVSHYFVTVSSRDEKDAVLYEDLGDTITKVRMTGGVLRVLNAPVSEENRRAGASILSRAEYNIAREQAVDSLTASMPEIPLSDWLADVLGNNDFSHYRSFPVHQTLRQDSLKTINNFETIQSVVMDWKENRLILSYAPSYAGFGPFFAYDIATGRLSPFRDAAAGARSDDFRADNAFLFSVFVLAQHNGMSLDQEGWARVLGMIAAAKLNPFLAADWTCSASLALKRWDDAERAARQIDTLLPDYYLGAFQRGMAAYGRKDWQTARTCFLESEARPINSPAGRLVAVAYASLASRKLNDRQREAELAARARLLLGQYWVPQDISAQVNAYLNDEEVAALLGDVAKQLARR